MCAEVMSSREMVGKAMADVQAEIEVHAETQRQVTKARQQTEDVLKSAQQRVTMAQQETHAVRAIPIPIPNPIPIPHLRPQLHPHL
jgi:hypothetical protein